MPSNDLVHGDLSPANVLIRDGEVAAVIDVEALGAGSRLHDLATLTASAWLWGERTTTERILDHARATARRGQLQISLAAVLLGLYAFGAQHWPPADLSAACTEGINLLKQITK